MPSNSVVAAVQMDANPAPLADRLARAEWLVANAAAQGAQLVLLPELFNSGYGYAAGPGSAETIDGPTIAWMHATAARYGVHLAGSLLLHDAGAIYNSMLLVAPDGRRWRYDKRYPWAWERGSFRGGHSTTVAHTALGRVGMLVCWDVAHPALWRRYASAVDLMLVSSCPPNIGEATFEFATGSLAVRELGSAMGWMRGVATRVFGPLIDEQTAWLGVPAVCSVGCGRITTPLPNGLATTLAFLPLAPAFARFLPRARGVTMSCAMTPGCKIVGANGAPIAALTQAQGEAFALARLAIAAAPPRPRGKQPRTAISPLAYLSSDYLLPLLAAPAYRAGLRRRRTKPNRL